MKHLHPFTSLFFIIEELNEAPFVNLYNTRVQRESVLQPAILASRS